MREKEIIFSILKFDKEYNKNEKKMDHSFKNYICTGTLILLMNMLNSFDRRKRICEDMIFCPQSLRLSLLILPITTEN